jgi:hypothetical protein
MNGAAELQGALPALLSERLTRFCDAAVVVEAGGEAGGGALGCGAWCEATLWIDEAPWRAWFGLERASAIALGGALLKLHPLAVADLVASPADTPLMLDAFNEVANLAFAAMDDVLRGALGDGVHTDGRRSRLTAPAPEGERVLRATLAVGGGEAGAVEICLRRAA